MSDTNTETNVAAEELRAFIERAERLNEEAKTIGEDLKELFSECKGRGYDVKVVKEIIKLRATDPNKRAEHDAILATYCSALGMGVQESLPFGQVTF